MNRRGAPAVFLPPRVAVLVSEGPRDRQRRVDERHLDVPIPARRSA
jgi:hypothetical protein